MIDANDRRFMSRALELAGQGLGHVEPNPMVGCVLVVGGEIVGEGWHRDFGGPHAEIAALRAAGNRAEAATAFVTLEPCCLVGKTPPCTSALIRAGVAKVVVGCRDPNPEVAGGGLAQLRAAGIDVAEGLLGDEATRLIAPFCKLVTQKRPWVIAKWAITLDGKLASRTGSSQWISGAESRALVHQLRGRVDAILVGRRTAVLDNPLLTARPRGARIATRVVLDTHASLSCESKLIQSIQQAPVLVAVAETAPPERRQRLEEHGAEILILRGDDRRGRLESLLDELGQRQMTSLLVEGGASVLGALFDSRQIDEIHAFTTPKLIGGEAAPSAIGGQGFAEMSTALRLQRVTTELLGEDVHVHGYVEGRRES